MSRKSIFMNIALVGIIASLMIDSISTEPNFGGENVCNSTKTIKREKKIAEPIKYEIKYQSMCGILPCTKTRDEYRMDKVTKIFYEDVDVAICCPGYHENHRSECVPICLDPCKHGRCVAPNQCKCDQMPTESSPGFLGRTCNRFVCMDESSWGSNCDKACNCPENAYCNAATGKCLCKINWRGPNCTEACNSFTNCDEPADLPPIIEPEVNMVENDFAQAQRLLASEARSMDWTSLQEDGQSNKWSMGAILLNLSLISIVGLLVVALLWYKKKLDEARNELYYVSASSGGSSSGSEYAPSETSYSTGTNIQKRARMPLPNNASNMSKNVSFAEANRQMFKQTALGSILLGGTNKVQDLQKDSREQLVLDPKVESHLIRSHAKSKSNIYSDMESSIGSSVYQTISESSILPQILVESKSTSTDDNETYQHYQIPKSPVPSSNLNSSSEHLMSDEASQKLDDPYSNIYEEIPAHKKPKSP